MPPFPTSRTALSSLKAGYRSTSAPSTRSFVSRTFWGGNHGPQLRRPDPVSRAPFPSSAVPSEWHPSTTNGAAMPQKSNSDQADLGLSDPYRDDWGQSTYKIDPEAFRQPISFATPTNWDRSSTLPTSPNLGLHDANLDSQGSAIPPSDKSPSHLAEDSSQRIRSSISTSTAAPQSGEESRPFVWHGNSVFADLAKNNPRSQSK